jgi:hypothetical protein
MSDHRYTLKYRLDEVPEGFDVAEAKAAVEEGFGSCNAAILISVLNFPDGSSSRLIHSADGSTGQQVDDDELFHAFALLASRLSQSSELDDGRKQFAALVFHQIRQAVAAAAGGS